MPALLQGAAEGRWQGYLQAAQEVGARVPRSAEFRACACRVFAISEFVAGLCRRDPQLLTDLLDSGDLLADSWPGTLLQRVHDALGRCKDEAALHSTLRRLRQREMLRIAWRDLAGWAELGETLRDLSDLADGCIQGALARLEAWQAAETPAPLAEGRRPAQLVVIAMGKLGAHELNFSSDIDLIFAYPDARPARKRGALSPEQYFTRLGQALIQALSSHDADGFVFRVDMRLRPYGDSGALVCSYEALEEYYQSQGREWERYAMIKARPVTGDPAAQQALMQLLRPFVYRRYLDFHTFDALRDLKRQIHNEVERKGQEDHLKLGPGGIREIEFIAQAFQLVRGGREPRLRQRGVIAVLRVLAALKLLPGQSVSELIEAYAFLRRAENRLQAMQDRQIHQLPESEENRARLAEALGCRDWKAFYKVLNKHRRRVEAHFQQVFASPQAEKPAPQDPLSELWQGRLETEAAVRVLENAGYDDPAEALRWLEQLRSGSAQHYLGAQGRVRWDALLPMVLGAVGRQPQPAVVLGRLAGILEHIAGRTTYLALLQENPLVLSQLVKLCAASPWIAQQIERFPLLLDQLLDPRTLYEPLAPGTLDAELEQYFRDVAPDDLERQMDLLRQFRHAMVLRVAAADIAGVIPVTLVSEQLTAIAEVVLRKVLVIAWAEMVKRYGEPRCRERGKTRTVAFAVIAYGKLGGRELGYGSDLDLVFLHDSTGSRQKTAGRKSVDNAVFFTRLGQRIIHMLETFTAAGTLYEVDMRLRPSGNSGMLVSSVEAFADYQREEAWVWEHQALVRARQVAGDARLGKAFGKVRAAALARDSKLENLRAEVRDMRERMRGELGSRRGAGFHLKQDRGGIVDIEFMVQYLVLRWCKDHPELLRHTDTINLLKALSTAGLLKAAYAQTLIEAYQQYRSISHRLTLAEESTLVGDEVLPAQRKKVAEIWQRLMES
ncbi:MAG TPA: bifunctional [glutamate--ammonia ligase]-adenylyl-L-tyrosine phosphorylase/[glutamate--ammonia-ligase] adenylyltransferase [Gammaproteobacteria bacterium]|nr:bifunctional [glutamate--ammonia ligase]-adenylyl-L-tyrosine phosphorylase/[glutamate--ammonia-ligase] adenylyltransferase [Gammaproteobacteria bacterium]